VFRKIIRSASGKQSYCALWNTNIYWWLSFLDVWKTSVVIWAGANWRSIIFTKSVFPETVCKACSLFLFDVYINAITKRKKSFRFAYVWFQCFHWISHVSMLLLLKLKWIFRLSFIINY
jgi:hypothetical protein